MKKLGFVLMVCLLSLILTVGCSTSTDTTTTTAADTTTTTTTATTTSTTTTTTISTTTSTSLSTSTTTAETTTTTSTGTTTTTAGGGGATIALSGTLNSGSISAAGLKNYAAVPDYSVVAIDNASGLSYLATTDADGYFECDVPSNASYEVSLVNSSNTYFGPIVMSGNSSSDEVVMGITPTSNTSLGSITVDSNSYIAQPDEEPSLILNHDDVAEATGGVPKGALDGLIGKSEISGLISRESGADIDCDGIPNIFDPDQDNNGIRNGILSGSTGPSIDSDIVYSVTFASNIWAPFGSSTSEAPDLIALRLFVRTIDQTALEQIQSVQCIKVPTSIASVARVRNSGSLGDPEDYPEEESLWSDDDYHLHKTTTLDENCYVTSITPTNRMNIGDTFTVRVTYVDSSYEDFFITMSYVLTDWARIISYNGTATPSNEGDSESNPITFSGSSLEVEVSKARDEDGNTLAGGIYSIEVSTSEGEPTEYRLTDLGADTITGYITLETPAAYYFTPVAEMGGQRNGESVWFSNE